MPIKLIVRPDVASWTPEQFIQLTPRYSIGLDGIVAGGSWYDPATRHANFNHHDCMSRLAVRATCEQVYLAIVQGFFRAFQNGNSVELNIFLNHPDEDICLSVYLLRNRKVVGQEANGRLRRLVETEGKIDATCGTYRMTTTARIWRELAWIFDPYRRFKMSGEIFAKDAAAYERIIDEVGERIQANVNGRGKEIEFCEEMLAYQKIGGGPGWAMIIEQGEYGRRGAIGDGIEAFVTVQKRPDGNYQYVLGRISEWIPFDIPGLLVRLNELEGLQSANDRWGGADIIGGSPRLRGSAIPPEDLEKIVNEHQAA
jgi:hypothetical protein